MFCRLGKITYSWPNDFLLLMYKVIINMIMMVENLFLNSEILEIFLIIITCTIAFVHRSSSFHMSRINFPLANLFGIILYKNVENFLFEFKTPLLAQDFQTPVLWHFMILNLLICNIVNVVICRTKLKQCSILIQKGL